MEKFQIQGGFPLNGSVNIHGAKNVALKSCIASLLTDEPMQLHQIPLIKDIYLTTDILTCLGVKTTFNDHTLDLHFSHINNTKIPLDIGARLRTSSLILGPLLARFGEATIPNPGGCRIGARPIDRHIEGLISMGAEITYDSSDGFFHAKTKSLHGANIRFEKNTHTGTEAILLAAVLAKGETIIDNAAEEVEVDDLILLLQKMGATIVKTKPRQIVIQGVSKLHGVSHTIMLDRNEEVTWAIIAAITNGKISIQNSIRHTLASFLIPYEKIGGIVEHVNDSQTTYSRTSRLSSIDITTTPHPGFMTDWQAPWAVLMTQAQGYSVIHESVFESRFAYVNELQKMGAQIEYFQPHVDNPSAFYNFNWNDKLKDSFQAIRIFGPTKLHNAVLEMHDLRAGASLVLAALCADGESIIHGVDQIDRGYETIEKSLTQVGAHITRIQEEDL